MADNNDPVAARFTVPPRVNAVLTFGLILLGCALRLVWALHGHLSPTGGESDAIARALAEGRGFADAFGPGSGPTAHLMPLTPLPTAAAYAVFGVASRNAELALTLWALAVLAVSFVLADRVARALGLPLLGRLAALACVALLPIQVSLEVDQFREWEAGVAAAGMLALLLTVLHLDRTRTVGWRALAALGLGNGALLLISPPAGLATSGAIGLYLLLRVSWRRWWIAILPAVVLVSAVLLPWGLRNQQALGQFTPLRTGEGISMALSYYDGKAGDSGPRLQALDLQRIQQVSPQRGGAARQRYLQVGEVAYNRELSAAARAWMAAHPADVMKIRARNFLQFYAPPAWLWTRFTKGEGSFVALRRGFLVVTTLLALATLAHGLVRRRTEWMYVAVAVLLPCLAYVATYPLLRYRYVVSTLLIFIGVGGACQLAMALMRKLHPPASPRLEP